MILYKCPNGHTSSVTRIPNDQGIRKCFFCGKVAEEIEVVVQRTEPKTYIKMP